MSSLLYSPGFCPRWEPGRRGKGWATHSSKSSGSPASRVRLPRAPQGPRGARGLLVSRVASPAPAVMWSGSGPSNVTLLGTVSLPGPSTFCFQSMAQRRTAHWRLCAACNGLCQLMPCPAPGPGEGERQAHLHLLLGAQLLPEGLHASCEPQEARHALPEKLLVVGLHRSLQPRLLSPPLQHEAQPRGPRLQGDEEVRPSSPCSGSPRLCPQPTLPSEARPSPGRGGEVGCGAPITLACREKAQNHRARAVPCCSCLLFTSYGPERRLWKHLLQGGCPE